LAAKGNVGQYDW